MDDAIPAGPYRNRVAWGVLRRDDDCVSFCMRREASFAGEATECLPAAGVAPDWKILASGSDGVSARRGFC